MLQACTKRMRDNKARLRPFASSHGTNRARAVAGSASLQARCSCRLKPPVGQSQRGCARRAPSGGNNNTVQVAIAIGLERSNGALPPPAKAESVQIHGDTAAPRPCGDLHGSNGG
ncbi:hypothetical protein LBMAG39_09720 [Cyanobium sp.]|nr:hypothetical protein LBMAG39_09720 [Cyanobium sp.]